MASDPSDGFLDQLTLQEADFIAALREVPQGDQVRVHAALAFYFANGGDLWQMVHGHAADPRRFRN